MRVVVAVPGVSVFDERARVAHEVAIGSVDIKQVVLWNPYLSGLRQIRSQIRGANDDRHL